MTNVFGAPPPKKNNNNTVTLNFVLCYAEDKLVYILPTENQQPTLFMAAGSQSRLLITTRIPKCEPVRKVPY